MLVVGVDGVVDMEDVGHAAGMGATHGSDGEDDLLTPSRMRHKQQTRVRPDLSN